MLQLQCKGFEAPQGALPRLLALSVLSANRRCPRYMGLEATVRPSSSFEFHSNELPINNRPADIFNASAKLVHAIIWRPAFLAGGLIFCRAFVARPSIFFVAFRFSGITKVAI